MINSTNWNILGENTENEHNVGYKALDQFMFLQLKIIFLNKISR